MSHIKGKTRTFPIRRNGGCGQRTFIELETISTFGVTIEYGSIGTVANFCNKI